MIVTIGESALITESYFHSNSVFGGNSNEVLSLENKKKKAHTHCHLLI